MISAEKQLLRASVTKSLRLMSDGERAEKSSAIAAHLAEVSGVVFGFSPMRLEPDWTSAIGAAWRVALPRIDGNRLRFHRVDDFATLVRGSSGTREPVDGEEVEYGDANVVLTPGVAFDRMGRRLGRGGGFYDRLMAAPALAARRVAVCFACQIVERVPVEPHDVEVDAIVTENGWLEVRNSGCGRD